MLGHSQTSNSLIVFKLKRGLLLALFFCSNKSMKNELRKICIEKRKLISDKKIKDDIIMQKIFELEEFKKAKNILTYYPLKYEIDTTCCFTKCDKNWYLPRCNNLELDICKYEAGQLICGSFKIMEPVGKKIDDYSIIDMVVTPAVAVDINGYRLGYGKGFYDRLFPKLNKNCVKVFVAYQDLVLPDIYPCCTDVKCDVIVTEEKIYKI